MSGPLSSCYGDRMSTTPKPKFAQELAKRIVNTKGMTAADRAESKRTMTAIAFEDDPLNTTGPIGNVNKRLVLAALQVVARDEQAWTALVAARAALGKR